jgi:hypothetical protein
LVMGFHLPIVGTENKQLIHPSMSSAIEWIRDRQTI